MRQPDLFAAPPRSTERAPPNLSFIRKSLGARLRLLRAAEIVPWSDYETSQQVIHFPRLAALLPAEEAQEAIDAFFRELDRLGWPRAA